MVLLGIDAGMMIITSSDNNDNDISIKVPESKLIENRYMCNLRAVRNVI
jgi:hypothetical protein